MKVKRLTLWGLVNIEYSGNDEEYIVRNMVEKDLSQVVSRGHSRKKKKKKKFFSKDWTICSVFTTENLVIGNN